MRARRSDFRPAAVVALLFALGGELRAQPMPRPAAPAHPVVRLAEARLVSGSLPGRRTDGQKLCLVIEGGAMRGVVSAGMVTALERLRLRDAFDAVYGTSAGAINGAYFLAGQAEYGTAIYYDHLNNSRFISRWRLIGPGPPLSIDFALDRVMAHERILDWRAVLESPIALKVVVSSMERRRAEMLEDFRSRRSLWQSLRASARIPVIAGQPVEIGEDRFIDGLVYAAIPLDLAVADRCTHVLVLQTRPSGVGLPRPGPLRRWLVRRYLGKFDPALARRYGEAPSAYDRTIATIRRASASGDGPPYVLGVAPEPGRAVSTLEKGRRRLLGAAHEGCRALLDELGRLRDDTACPSPWSRPAREPARSRAR